MRDGFRIKPVRFEASPNWSVVFPMAGKPSTGNAHVVTPERSGKAK
jgi:hypothetical protein